MESLTNDKKMMIFECTIALLIILGFVMLFIKASVGMVMFLISFYIIDYRNKKFPDDYLEYKIRQFKNANIEGEPKIFNFPLILKIFITLILLFFILIAISIESYKPNYVMGYVNKDITVKNQTYKKYQQIRVDLNSKTDTTIKVNANGVDIGATDLKNIVFSGTEEYTKMLEQKKQEEVAAEKKRQLEAKLKAEIDKAVNEEMKKLESNIDNVFYKVDLKIFSEDGNGVYEFYIAPLAWFSLNVDQKENIFRNCVAYAQWKTKGANQDYYQLGTKILSSSNREVLAEYSVFKGLKVK